MILAVFSSVAAMGQEKKSDEPDWMKDLASRITLNGYAQAGWSYQDPNGVKTNAYNLKRTLLWAKARITDRWSFLFMHDFSSVVQEFYTDYRVSNDKSLSVRLGQFKHSYTMENPLSPTALELIDVYSQAVLYLAGEGPDPLNGVNYGRDMGLMVYGDLADKLFHYELALMSGQGINRKDNNNQKDFIAKLEIALKEANETENWLTVCNEANLIDNELFNTLHKQVIQINLVSLLYVQNDTPKQKRLLQKQILFRP